MQVSRWWKYVAFALLAVWIGTVAWLWPGYHLRESREWFSSIQLNRAEEAEVFTSMHTIARAVGSLLAFEGDPKGLPPGAMKCEGQVLRKDVYPELSAQMGDSHAEDEQHFRLPDYRGSFVPHYPEEEQGDCMYSGVSLGKRSHDAARLFTPIVWVIQAK